jgi:hypothetical protein
VAALSTATEALASALTAQVRADAKGKKKPPMPVMEDEETREGSEDEEMEMEEEEMDGGAANLGSYQIPKKDGGMAGMVPKAMYDKACAERDDAIAAHERDLGRLDALVDRLDSLEQEIDSRVDSDIDVDALVASRLELIDRATAITGERPTFDGLTDREVMIDALTQVGVDAERFEGRSDDYVAATFDAYAEQGMGRVDSADPLAAAIGGIPMSSGGQDAARERMIRGAQENSRKPLTITKGA